MGDCESKGADKGGPNVRELRMKRPKDRHPEDVEGAQGSNGEVMGACRNGREIRSDLRA